MYQSLSSSVFALLSPPKAAGNRWRSWLRHCVTRRKVAGSIPDGVIGIFYWHNPSGRNMSLPSTQPLTETSTRNISCVLKAAGACGWQPYHLHVPIVLKYGGLNLPEPSGRVHASFTLTFTSSPKSDSRFHTIFPTGRLETVRKFRNFSLFQQQMLKLQTPRGLIWRWEQYISSKSV